MKKLILILSTMFIVGNLFGANVGIGTTSPATKLDVVGDINNSGSLISQTQVIVGTTTTSPNILSGSLLTLYGTLNGYLQLNFKNASNSVLANSASVWTRDNGTDTDNYFEVGTNNSNYVQSGYETQPSSSSFVHNRSGSLLVGVSDSSPSRTSYVAFFTSTTATGGERMRINAVGNIGVGTTNPQTLLECDGQFSVYGATSTKLTAQTVRYIERTSTGVVTYPTGLSYISTDGTGIIYANPVAYNTVTTTAGVKLYGVYTSSFAVFNDFTTALKGFWEAHVLP